MSKHLLCWGIALSLLLNFGVPEAAADSPASGSASAGVPFVDVPFGSSFYNSVGWATTTGITTGTSSTTFSPGEPCKRYHILTFIWREEGCPEPNCDMPYCDVTTTTSDFQKAARWAYEIGLEVGTVSNGNTYFDGDTICTRDQAVYYLWKLAKLKGASYTSTENLDFPDVPADSSHAEAVAWAVEMNITNGKGRNAEGKLLFSPGESCTRGHIVTFLYRFVCAMDGTQPL